MLKFMEKVALRSSVKKTSKENTYAEIWNFINSDTGVFM